MKNNRINQIKKEIISNLPKELFYIFNKTNIKTLLKLDNKYKRILLSKLKVLLDEDVLREIAFEKKKKLYRFRMKLIKFNTNLHEHKNLIKYSDAFKNYQEMDEYYEKHFPLTKEQEEELERKVDELLNEIKTLHKNRYHKLGWWELRKKTWWEELGKYTLYTKSRAWSYNILYGGTIVAMNGEVLVSDSGYAVRRYYVHTLYVLNREGIKKAIQRGYI